MNCTARAGLLRCITLVSCLAIGVVGCVADDSGDYETAGTSQLAVSEYCDELLEAIEVAEAAVDVLDTRLAAIDDAIVEVKGRMDDAARRLGDAQDEIGEYSEDPAPTDYVESGGRRITSCDLAYWRAESRRLWREYRAGALSARELSEAWSKVRDTRSEDCLERFDPKHRKKLRDAAVALADSILAELELLRAELVALHQERDDLRTRRTDLQAELARLRAEYERCLEETEPTDAEEPEPPVPAEEKPGTGTGTGEPNPWSEWTDGIVTDGCDANDRAKLLESYQQACTTARKTLASQSRVSAAIFERLCDGRIPVTLHCVQCDKNSPSPCAWGQPNLPVRPASGNTMTINTYQDLLKAAGGVHLRFCANNYGHLAPVAARGELKACGTLRYMVLHELWHFVINTTSHNSGYWDYLDSFVYPGEVAGN